MQYGDNNKSVSMHNSVGDVRLRFTRDDPSAKL